MRRVIAIKIAGVLVGALCFVVALTLCFQLSRAIPASSSLANVTASYEMQVFGRPSGTDSYLSKLPPVQPSLAYGRVFSLHDVTDRYSAVEIRSMLQYPASGSTAGLIPLDNSQKYHGPVLVGSTAMIPGTAEDAPAPIATAQATLAGTAGQSAASFTDTPSSSGLVDDTPTAFDSRLQDSAMAVSMPIRVGEFTLRNTGTTAQFSEAPSSETRVRNYTWTAATNFDVQSKRHELNVDLGTDYAHVNTGSVASFSYNVNSTSAALADLQSVNPALLASNANAPVDVTAQGFTSGLALPLNRRVTLGLQYGAQRFTGAYGLAATPNLDTSKYSYLGNLTFALRPNTAITLSARQYHYQDNLVPSNNYYQTRADLDFTVKL